MPISLIDDQISYLLSDEVKSNLKSFNEDKIDSEIDVRKLMEFAFERERLSNAGSIASMQKAGLSEKAITRIIYTLVYESYKNQLDCIVAAFKRSSFVFASNKINEEEYESRIAYQQKRVEKEFKMAACAGPDVIEKAPHINKSYRKGGGTDLHFAAEKGDMEQVKALVADGIDILVKDNAKMTAAAVARCHGFFEISKYLNDLVL